MCIRDSPGWELQRSSDEPAGGRHELAWHRRSETEPVAPSEFQNDRPARRQCLGPRSCRDRPTDHRRALLDPPELHRASDQAAWAGLCTRRGRRQALGVWAWRARPTMHANAPPWSPLVTAAAISAGSLRTHRRSRSASLLVTAFMLAVSTSVRRGTCPLPTRSAVLYVRDGSGPSSST